ncbi:MAG TPA: T9SS type A sorting domain-containing protein, partial [Chitinophagaceae bacterium]
FYTNKSFSDQWNYAMAAYQKPGGVYVSYTDLTDPAGTIVSTNGSYKAGTPLPWLSYIVSGGSGNGGNNYTGSNSSNDNFTACQPTATTGGRIETITTAGQSAETAVQVETPVVAVQANTGMVSRKAGMEIFPNPASSYANISFGTTLSGKCTIKLFNANGVQLEQIFNATAEAGKPYSFRYSSSGLANGVYYVRLENDKETIVRKFVIIR